jgi:fructosamine-3-kinase
LRSSANIALCSSSTWPLATGSAERLELYKLYHVLNHLNLFGAGYLDQALTILRRLF